LRRKRRGRLVDEPPKRCRNGTLQDYLHDRFLRRRPNEDAEKRKRKRRLKT